MSSHDENSHHRLDRDIARFEDIGEQADFLVDVAAISAAPEPAGGGEQPMGRRLRELREQRGLSLADVSQRTGLDQDFLASLEAEEAVSPPLGDLIKLGKALDMEMGTLIAAGEERPYTVVRVADRRDMSRFASRRVSRYGYTYQALAPQMKGRNMEPFLVTLRKSEEAVEPSSHDGEEFILVLEGQMEALIGEARELLSPGDAIYYKSINPHLVRPAGDEEVRIVAVIYAGGK